MLHTNSQYTLPEIDKRLANQANREDAAEQFPDPSVRKAVAVGISLSDSYDQMVGPGALFVLDLGTAPDRPFLRVWPPPTVTSSADLQQLTGEVSRLRASSRTRWIDDPTADTPTHRLEWNGKA